MDKQIIIADSTQLESFVTCERLWNYGHNLRLTAHDARPNEAMLMGTYGHALLERWYKAQFHPAISNAPTLINMVIEDYDPDNETCECGCSIKDHPFATHDRPGLCLNHSVIDGTCTGWSAKPFPLGMPQRAEVRDRFRTYCYTYSQNDFVPASANAVEVGFSHKLYEDDQYLFILEGKMDISDATLGGLPCIVDHKFQLRRHDIYKKSIQFRNYAMVKRARMLVINYIRLAKTISKDTFVRDIASFTDQEHDWWHGELVSIYKRMAAAIHGEWIDNATRRLPGTFDPHWSSCSGRFGYKCEFTDLCETQDESFRKVKQDTMYSIKPEWKPW